MVAIFQPGSTQGVSGGLYPSRTQLKCGDLATGPCLHQTKMKRPFIVGWDWADSGHDCKVFGTSIQQTSLWSCKWCAYLKFKMRLLGVPCVRPFSGNASLTPNESQRRFHITRIGTLHASKCEAHMIRVTANGCIDYLFRLQWRSHGNINHCVAKLWY